MSRTADRPFLKGQTDKPGEIQGLKFYKNLNILIAMHKKIKQ